MEKSPQVLLKIITFMAITIITVALYVYEIKLMVIWLLSIGIGFVLTRSGMCFGVAFSDIFMFRSFHMTRGLLIMTGVTLAGIGVIQYFTEIYGLPLPGRFYPAGVHTVVGAFLFGIGMVLAGACSSGILQRIGEGYLLYIAVLIAMVAGSLLGAYHFAWWATTFPGFEKSIYLRDILGWPWGLVASLAVIGALFGLTYLADKKPLSRRKGGTHGNKKNQYSRRSVSGTFVDSEKGIAPTEPR